MKDFHDLTSYEATVDYSGRRGEFCFIVIRLMISDYRNTAATRVWYASCSELSGRYLYIRDVMGSMQAM